MIFLRTIGGAIGVGLLGATLGWGLAHRLARAGATGIDVVAALRPETHQVSDPPRSSRWSSQTWVSRSATSICR